MSILTEIRELIRLHGPEVPRKVKMDRATYSALAHECYCDGMQLLTVLGLQIEVCDDGHSLTVTD